MLSIFQRLPQTSSTTSFPRCYFVRFASSNTNQQKPPPPPHKNEEEKPEPETPKIEILKGKFKKTTDDVKITEGNPKLLSTIIPAVQRALIGGRSQSPMNWSYANKKMIDDLVEELPLGEVVDATPAIAIKQYQLIKEEVKEIFDNPLEKPDLLNYFDGLKHGEAKVEYDFKTDKNMEIWNTGCDSDWTQGYSNAEFIRTPRNTALFRGYICTEPVKDGKIRRAGWASIKTEDFLAFKRKKKLWLWKDYSHMMIKCRGDGRSYKIMLYVPGAIDVTWGDCYGYPLHTHGGPYWQYEKIPFSRFLHTVGGRVQDSQKRIFNTEISSVGITLMDRIDGEFQLEIDFIGCYNDRSHEEKFAYESYSIPMFNPQTM